MADAPGSRVGHYRLTEPIGTGGFATVYRAVDERLDSDVAVKILAENHALDPDIRERFITEAQLLRRVASPAVIEIHDVGETERNQPFIVMSHADRGDLRRRVAELDATVASTRADIDHVIAVLTTALGAVHAAGLVHRDVKPDNLLISATGGGDHAGTLLRSGERLRLGDLGYAKDLGASSGLTVGGGTHGFNAPEQRHGIGSIDARADIYGASAVVFWLLTGTTPPATAKEQRSLLLPTVADTQMIDALVIGLADAPADRFEQIIDWHDALLAGASPNSGVVPRGPTTARSSRPRWLLAATAAIVGLLVGVGAMTMVSSDDGPTVGTTDDGRTRVEDGRGDLRLAVFGPTQVTVGDTADFEAAVQGATSFVWVLPDGSTADGISPIGVTFASTGIDHLTLVGRDRDGATLSIDFEVTVTE